MSESEATETKPKLETTVAEPITIRVKTPDEPEDMYFKVKKSTKMQKIFEAYASRKGIAPDKIRFLFDGERITGEKTPDDLHLEDDDQIDVRLETTGGGKDEEDNEKEADDKDEKKNIEDTITLRVRDQNGEEMHFKVKKSTKMQKIFDAYAHRKGVPPSEFKFLLDGSRIKGDDTPKLLELEEDDQIDVMIEASGGGGLEGEDDLAHASSLTLSLKDLTGNTMQFIVKRSAKLEKIFVAYAQRKGMDMSLLQFTLDGEYLKQDDTPENLDLDDEDQIDVFLHMQGGGKENIDPKRHPSKNSMMKVTPVKSPRTNKCMDEDFLRCSQNSLRRFAWHGYSYLEPIGQVEAIRRKDFFRMTRMTPAKGGAMDDSHDLPLTSTRSKMSECCVDLSHHFLEPKQDVIVVRLIHYVNRDVLLAKCLPRTKMVTLKWAAAERWKEPISAWKLYLSGERVADGQTVGTLLSSIETGERDANIAKYGYDIEFDVFSESHGGGGGEDEKESEKKGNPTNAAATSTNQTTTAKPPSNVEDIAITLRVRDQAGEEMYFRVKKSSKMSKIFEAYASRKGIGMDSLRFLLDGERIKPEDTPKMLELEDDEQIDVMLEYQGGNQFVTK